MGRKSIAAIASAKDVGAGSGLRDDRD